MAENKSHSILSLIAIPALFTLAVTILRLVGEFEHWPRPWFDSSAGGGAALVGISWLPIFFGPYFAVKLAGRGEGPSGMGKAAGFMVLGLVIFVVGGFLTRLIFARSPSAALITLGVIGFLLMLGAAFVVRIGWRRLGNTLLAYALAARIPILVVMFLAMVGHWGTHYDAVPAGFPGGTPLVPKFLELAVLPQMTLWIGWTVVVGALVGIIVAAIARAGRRTVRADAG